jgi:micrococcal nuclease
MTSDHDVRREIRQLSAYLREGEAVQRLVTGIYGAGAGLLAVTDHRVLLLRDGRSGQASEGFPLGRLTSAEWVAEGTHATVTVSDSISTAVLRQVPIIDAEEVVALIKALIGETPHGRAQGYPGALGLAERTTTALRTNGSLHLNRRAPANGVGGHSRTTVNGTINGGMANPTAAHSGSGHGVAQGTTTTALRTAESHRAPESHRAAGPNGVRDDGAPTASEQTAMLHLPGRALTAPAMDWAGSQAFMHPVEQGRGIHTLSGAVPVRVIATSRPPTQHQAVDLPRQPISPRRHGRHSGPGTLLGEVPVSELAAERSTPMPAVPVPASPVSAVPQTEAVRVGQLTQDDPASQSAHDNAPEDTSTDAQPTGGSAATAVIPAETARTEVLETPSSAAPGSEGTEGTEVTEAPDAGASDGSGTLEVDPTNLTAMGTERPRPISWQAPHGPRVGPLRAAAKPDSEKPNSEKAELGQSDSATDTTDGTGTTDSDASAVANRGAPKRTEARDQRARPLSSPSAWLGRRRARAKAKRWVWLGAGAAGLIGVAAVGSAMLITSNDHNGAAAPVNPTPAAAVNSPLGPVVTVSRVVAGDRIEVSGPVNGLVVALGIISPSGQSCGATESKEFALRALSNQMVTLVSDPSQPVTDKAGHRLAYLRLPDGTDYSTQAVQAGMAKYFDQGTPVGSAAEIKDAQNQAKQTKAGLWGAPCNGKFASSAGTGATSASNSTSGASDNATTRSGADSGVARSEGSDRTSTDG